MIQFYAFFPQTTSAVCDIVEYFWNHEQIPKILF